MPHPAPFQPEDEARVYALLNDSRVTDTLLDIDQPFTPVQAGDWIQRGVVGLLKEDCFLLALTRREDGLLIGCIDLELNLNAGGRIWLTK